jgi:hypothetical protein
MRRAFDDLADSDAGVRESARAALMGLDRRYLPSLQKLVDQQRPLRPSQASVLRQIVTHVYLAGEPYPSDRTAGFLGVRMSATAVRLDTPDPAAAAAGGEQEGNNNGNGNNANDGNAGSDVAPMGVVILERLPGFVGHRMLLDGDVVVGIDERPDLRLFSDRAAADDLLPLRVFTDAVKGTRPGRTLHFQVLRRGRLVKVPVTLDPRPDAAAAAGGNPAPTDAFDRQRREKADAYWRESFAPLLREAVG